MKKYISGITAFALLCGVTFGLSSCKDALETKIYGELVPETFFQTESDLQAAVVGAMIYVSGRGVGTDYGLWTSHWVGARMLGMMVADELYSQNQGPRWSQWIFQPSDGTADNGGGRPEYNWAVWQFNRVSAKITSLIHDFETCPIADSNPELVAEYTRQLKGLRALYMYTLYIFFGPVNTTLNWEDLGSNEPMARLSDEEYRAAIESDLAAVFESELPDVQPAGMRGYVSMDFFRMLAIRYYMYTAQWSKAETLCRYLMNSGNYSLVRQGNDVYSAYEMAVNTCPNSETIFSCPADKSHGNIWVTEVTFSGAAALGPGQNVTTSGWGMGYMLWEHFHSLYGNEGEPAWTNDTRRNTVWHETYRRVRMADGSRVLQLQKENPDASKGESSLVGAIPVKFTNWWEDSYSEFVIEQPAYRLADVYLYLAECIVRQQGVTSEAQSLVADIRERAGLGRDLTANLTPRQLGEAADPTSSTEAFLNFILWERGRELMCEGQRWEDLKRHDMLVQRAFEQGKISNIAANQFRTLLPLPHDVVLQSNGVVKQNPGYTTVE